MIIRHLSESVNANFGHIFIYIYKENKNVKVENTINFFTMLIVKDVFAVIDKYKHG